MNFEDLSPELQDKVRACQTAEEILALAKQEGYELSEEALEAVAGGGDWTDCDNYARMTQPCLKWTKYSKTAR